MRGVCSVAECKTGGRVAKAGVSFHKFPIARPQFCKIWIKRCRRADPINTRSATICSEHFEESAYVRDLQNELLGLPVRRRLKPDAVPTLFHCRNPPDPNGLSSSTPSSTEQRRIRMERRRNRELVDRILKEHEETPAETDGDFLIIKVEPLDEPEADTEAPGAALTCPICNRTFSTKYSFQRHRARTKRSDSDQQQCRVRRDAHEIQIPRNPFRCTAKSCGLEFPTLREFDLHNRAHTLETPWKCPECGLYFTKQFFLKAHIRSHTK